MNDWLIKSATQEKRFNLANVSAMHRKLVLLKLWKKGKVNFLHKFTCILLKKGANPNLYGQFASVAERELAALWYSGLFGYLYVLVSLFLCLSSVLLICYLIWWINLCVAFEQIANLPWVQTVRPLVIPASPLSSSPRVCRAARTHFRVANTELYLAHWMLSTVPTAVNKLV